MSNTDLARQLATTDLSDLKALVANLGDDDLLALMATLPAQQAPAAAPSLATDPDLVMNTVVAAGYGMAKGGRNYVTAESAEAITKVIATGAPVIVPAAAERGNERRGVTHVVWFRTAAGNVAMHPLYTKA